MVTPHRGFHFSFITSSAKGSRWFYKGISKYYTAQVAPSHVETLREIVELVPKFWDSGKIANSLKSRGSLQAEKSLTFIFSIYFRNQAISSNIFFLKQAFPKGPSPFGFYTMKSAKNQNTWDIFLTQFLKKCLELHETQSKLKNKRTIFHCL